MFIEKRLLSILLAAVSLTGCNALSPKNEAAFLQRGRDLLAAKDYPRALLEFRNAAKAAPKDAEPQYQMGLAYLQAGDYQSAVSSFRRCLEMNPNHTGAQLKTAEMMTSSNRPETVAHAADQLRGLLASSPENPDAISALAIAEWRMGNREQALQRLQKLLQDMPANLPSSLLLARMRLGQNDLAGAEVALRNAVASAPQSSEAALALGEMCLVTGQPEKAEAELRRAVQLNPKNGQALLALAAIQSAANRWAEAEDTYRRLSAMDEPRYKPLYPLFLLERGQTERGLSGLRELARQNPSDRVARTRLIEALLAAGQSPEAESLLSDALRANPKDTDALLQRSSLLVRARKIDEAQRDLRQVLEFHPDSAEAHRALSGTYKLMGQPRRERQELIEAVRLRAELLPARLALARNYLNANEPKVALQVLQEAPAPHRNLLPVWIERNWAMLAMNDLPALRESLDAALQIGHYPALVLQQALLRQASGDYSGARASAEEVLQADPGDARAARVLVESYVAQKQAHKALERLAQLAQASPRPAPLRHMLGLGLIARGDLSRGRAELEAALRAEPSFADAVLALADLDRRQNQTDAARTRLRTFLTATPGHVGAMLLLAEVEKSAGSHPGAIAAYREVLAADSSNLIALNNLSGELAESSPNEAFAFAQQALELAPDNSAVQDTLGWLCFRRGDYRAAVRYLKAAVDRDPNPRRQFHLALSYMKSGDRTLGQQLLQTAIRQDPSLGTPALEW